MAQPCRHRGLAAMAAARLPLPLQPHLVVGLCQLPLRDRCRALAERRCGWRWRGGAGGSGCLSSSRRGVRVLPQSHRRLRLLRAGHPRRRSLACRGRIACPPVAGARPQDRRSPHRNSSLRRRSCSAFGTTAPSGTAQLCRALAQGRSAVQRVRQLRPRLRPCLLCPVPCPYRRAGMDATARYGSTAGLSGGDRLCGLSVAAQPDVRRLRCRSPAADRVFSAGRRRERATLCQSAYRCRSRDGGGIDSGHPLGRHRARLARGRPGLFSRSWRHQCAATRQQACDRPATESLPRRAGAGGPSRRSWRSRAAKPSCRLYSPFRASSRWR